ncbi:MAG TPA: NUDIX hydrolase [Candidatus Eisenbacteria bacterium]|nr:NUDIX hydrolase [Candidatus Eisenbacteria bacterium]
MKDGKIVSRVGSLAASYVISDLRLERRGYLRLFSCAVEGAKHRNECVHRGSAVIVMPVDWTRGIVYLIVQPRPNKALVRHAEAAAALAVAATEGRCADRIEVPAEKIHVIDCPAGMIDGGETEVHAAIREVREETGFAIDASRLEQISDHFTSVGGSTERHVCFIADVSGLDPEPKAEGDGDERIVTLAFTFAEAADLFKQGLVDTGSLALMLRELKIREYERFLGRGV